MASRVTTLRHNLCNLLHPDQISLDLDPMGFRLKARRSLGLFRRHGFQLKKNFSEQIWKLANFVRHPKLLITKVSARKWPSVP
jgi:hypothetical protein